MTFFTLLPTVEYSRGFEKARKRCIYLHNAREEESSYVLRVQDDRGTTIFCGRGRIVQFTPATKESILFHTDAKQKIFLFSAISTAF